MRPPYLRRLDRQRRLDLFAAAFMSVVYLAFAISFARFIIYLAEHHPWL